MKIIAVVGPRGAGKTLVATSLAIYYNIVATAAFVDLSRDKRGAAMLRGLGVPIAFDLSEADAEYAVIDAAPNEVPRADRYVLVVDSEVEVDGSKILLVVNKARRPARRGVAVPLDPTIRLAMSYNRPPLLVANIKSWRHLAAAVLAAAGAPGAPGGRGLRWRAFGDGPEPPRWRPREMTITALAERLGVKFKRPDLWDVCRDRREPLGCYHVLLKAAEDEEAGSILAEALMSGADVDAVVEALAKGDLERAREAVYGRFKLAQRIGEAG